MPPPPPRRPGIGLGLLLMLGSVAAFTAMNAVVKDLRGHGMSTLEVMVWRSAPGLPLVWLELRLRGVSLRPRRPRVVALRTVLGCSAMASNFYAVHALALVQHTVVHLTQPVFVAIASPWLLRERMQLQAVIALALALCGALVVLLPPEQLTGAAALGAVAMPLLPGLVNMLSAASSALAHITLRLATGDDVPTRLDPGAPPDAPATVVFHFTWVVSVVGTAIGLAMGDFRSLPAALDTGAALGRIGAMAGLGLVGQLMMSSAYARAPAPIIAIVAYAAIPISAGLDAWLWHSPLSWSTWLGAGIMTGAGALLLYARGRAVTPSDRPRGP
ncbi:MAG: DMT family transporter [Nannocystaceae bacterium]